ncbi:unnamed protein product, partial [Meganyctiphanes norvegica]
STTCGSSSHHSHMLQQHHVNNNNNNNNTTTNNNNIAVAATAGPAIGLPRGGRLLECEHCHKHFTSRFNLQRHQLIHTGAKPYECPLCHQRFNQSGHVKTHLRTRHPTPEQFISQPNMEPPCNPPMH